MPIKVNAAFFKNQWVETFWCSMGFWFTSTAALWVRTNAAASYDHQSRGTNTWNTCIKNKLHKNFVKTCSAPASTFYCAKIQGCILGFIGGVLKLLNEKDGLSKYLQRVDLAQRTYLNSKIRAVLKLRCPTFNVVQ